MDQLPGARLWEMRVVGIRCNGLDSTLPKSQTSRRLSDTEEHCGLEFSTSGSPMIRELEAESRGVQEWLPAETCISGALIDARGLAAVMPEEEPESPGGVRSQRRRCLPSVDE